MKRKDIKKVWSSILCSMLIVAMAFSVTGCNDKKEQDASTQDNKQTEVSDGSDTNANDDSAAESTEEQASSEGSNVLGEGSMEFAFSVVDADGKETTFEIHSDKETVGEALLENELIAGDEGEYGLYVKTVNGITADYDTDGVYWAFYINGEYAQTGVDSTPVKEGESYSFKIEKG